MGKIKKFFFSALFEEIKIPENSSLLIIKWLLRKIPKIYSIIWAYVWFSVIYLLLILATIESFVFMIHMPIQERKD